MVNRLDLYVIVASLLVGANCLAKEVAIAKDVIVSKENPLIVGLRTTEKSKAPLMQEFVFEKRGVRVKFKAPKGWGDITQKIDSVDWLNVSSIASSSDGKRGCVHKPGRYGEDYVRAVCFLVTIESHDQAFEARVTHMKSYMSDRSKNSYVEQKVIFNGKIFDSSMIEAHEFSYIDLGKDGDLFLSRFIVARLLKSKAYIEFSTLIPLGAKDPSKMQKENLEFEKQLHSIVDSLEITASKK